jgi:hypothetical protein
LKQRRWKPMTSLKTSLSSSILSRSNKLTCFLINIK